MHYTVLWQQTFVSTRPNEGKGGEGIWILQSWQKFEYYGSGRTLETQDQESLIYYREMTLDNYETFTIFPNLDIWKYCCLWIVLFY